jgi:hypothetical protein
VGDEIAVVDQQVGRSRIDAEESAPAPDISTEVELESLRHDCWTAVASTKNSKQDSNFRRPVLSWPTVAVCCDRSLSM